MSTLLKMFNFSFSCSFFSVLVKFSRPHRASKRRFLVKFSKGPTVTVSTDDTAFRLFSVIPHHFFKFKYTALLLRRSTYVLFTPPQLSWQPNTFVILRALLSARRRFYVSRPIELLWKIIPKSIARSSAFVL